MRLTLLLFLALGSLWAQTDVDLFNDAVVQEIRLTMKASDLATLHANFLANDYYPADMRWLYNGRYISVPNIGIRSRGYGSRNPTKPNLRLDANHYDDNQTFVGLNAVDMKANNQDVSMVKERTVFHLFERAGLPTSRDVHARLYINEQYSGMYLMTEEVSKKFLKRVLGENDGDLFQYTPINQGFQFEWNPTCTTAKPVACSTDGTKWAPLPLNVETNDKTYDISQQINLFRTITEVSDANFETTVNALTNLKLWLFHNALEVFVADFDSIMGDVFGANNFYLYRWEKSPLQQFIVWDKDGSYDYSKRSIFQNTDVNVLMRRTLAIPARKTQYLESLYKVAVLAGGPGGWMEYENQRLYNQIRQGVYEDPIKQQNADGQYKPSTNELFDAEVAKNTKFLQERAPFVFDEVANAGFAVTSSIRITAGGVLNGASFAPGALAPGSLATAFGTGLATQTITVATAPLPTKLAGVSVIVNGFFAPLLYVSPTQINFQIPWELGVVSGNTPITVIIDGPTTKGATANRPIDATFGNIVVTPVKTYGPGVFLARRGDGSAVADGSAAAAGDVIVLYCTGLGPVSIPQTTGVLASLTTLVNTTETPVVTIGGQRAEILFSGLTPGTAGVYQINLRVPTGVPAGGAPLVVNIGNEASASYQLATR